MSKETENILRFAGLILVFLLIMGVALGRIRKLEKELEQYKNAPADTVTVIRHDTIKVDSPVPVYKYIKYNDTVTICHELRDTVKELVFLPREYMVYKDSTYRAVVSGVDPRLDSIEIYRPTITNTITKYVEVKKKPRWSIGLQAGYGYNGKDFKPYIGAGVQYNIVSW